MDIDFVYLWVDGNDPEWQKKRNAFIGRKDEDSSRNCKGRYADNDERIIFYARGVLETVKKLRWTPDIIHCQGWMTALAPLYIKKAYADDPFFKKSKIVYSVFDDDFKTPLCKGFGQKVLVDGVELADLNGLDKKAADFAALSKLAILYSDGVIQARPKVNKRVMDYAKAQGKKILPYAGEDYADAYVEFYDSLAGEE